MRKHGLLWALFLAGAVMLGLRCGDDKGSGPDVPRLILDIDSLNLDVSSSHQFEATFEGEMQDVYWYVNGLGGGSQVWGMITTGGLYVAPPDPPSGAFVTVTAKAVEDTTVEGSASVRVSGSVGTPLVRIVPGAVLVAVCDSVKLTSLVSNCTPDDVVLSLEPSWGAPASLGVIRPDGTYLAPCGATSAFVLMVKAASTGCTDITGIARIKVPASAGDFGVELEDFTVSHNIIHPAIEAISCGAASGGHAVVGLNEAGEYIEVSVTVPRAGTYVASVFYSSNQGQVIDVRVTVEGCGHASQQDDFRLDEGTGIG